MNNKKIELYLLNEKGYFVLNSIVEHKKQHLINYVVIGEDKNIVNDYSKEIKELCIKENITYFFRKNKEIEKKIDNIKIAIGWRWIIKESERLIVLHDSLLPKYRGFAPLVNSLINGERELGVTALFASENYDCGDIISQKKNEITYPLKIKEAIKQISKLYGEIILDIINNITSLNTLKRIVQNEKEATYSLWRDLNDYKIDWNKSAEEIKRFVDAVGNPYLGASTNLGEETIIIEDVEMVKDVKIINRDKHIGKIIFMTEEKPVIICKEGLIKIEKAIYKKTNISIFPINKFRLKLI